MFALSKFILFLFCCGSLLACALPAETHAPVAGPEPAFPATDKERRPKPAPTAKTKKAVAPMPSQLTAARADATGAELYSLHCAKCHKRLDKTNLSRLSPSRLRSSFTQYPIMAQFKQLSDAEVKKLAETIGR